MKTILRKIVPAVALASLTACAPSKSARQAEPVPAPAPAKAAAGQTIRLENQYMKLTLEPENGARISSWELVGKNDDLVQGWRRVRKMGKRKPAPKPQFSGGVLGGHMCGAYQDEQLEASYKVVKQSASEVSMKWKNPYTLFDGLEETRTVKLDGKTVTVRLKVRNTAKENRIIYYRIQDFIGVGHQFGEQTVSVYPSEEGITATVFQPGTTKALLSLKEPWYAQENLTDNYGIKVTASGAPLRNIMFFVGSSIEGRTCEFFWVPADLKPGETWQAELTYTLFEPKAETGLLAEDSVRKALNRTLSGKMIASASGCEFAPAYGAATVTPLAACGVIPQGKLLERFKTLAGLPLSGAKGETVLGAFALTVHEATKNGTISFGKFKQADGTELAFTPDPYYITRDGTDFMTRNWKFSAGYPQEAANTLSKIPAEKAITPYSLEAGETAHFRVYFKIPADAKAGEYTGDCTLTYGNGKKIGFKIRLHVWDFQLELPKDKGYGAFATFSLAGDKHYVAPKYGLSRKNFRKFVDEMTARNWRNLVLYLSNPENILWALDQMVDAGWRDARIVVIRPHVPYKKLMERYGKYNFKFLPWGVDEPVDYNSVRACAKKYELFQKKYDYPNMNFSANTPLSLAIIDSLPKTHPTIAVTGNVMYFVEKTRDLAKQNRQVFWYAGTPKKDVAGRLLRGIYVWKEPTGGMMDWGEMATTSTVKNGFHAFLADAELRPSQKLENVTQGLIDLMYLNTLEQTIRRADSNRPEVKDAQAFLDWVRNRFGTDYTGEAAEIDYGFLDMIRTNAAIHTENILKKGK
ncbi:MAG: hypothetical protein IJS14_10795 [Lentisphaeria bacterium]|nr:hypothetical protein [Lentisphaeria bacterium]